MAVCTFFVTVSSGNSWLELGGFVSTSSVVTYGGDSMVLTIRDAQGERPLSIQVSPIPDNRAVEWMVNRADLLWGELHDRQSFYVMDDFCFEQMREHFAKLLKSPEAAGISPAIGRHDAIPSSRVEGESHPVSDDGKMPGASKSRKSSSLPILSQRRERIGVDGAAPKVSDGESLPAPRDRGGSADSGVPVVYFWLGSRKHEQEFWDRYVSMLHGLGEGVTIDTALRNCVDASERMAAGSVQIVTICEKRVVGPPVRALSPARTGLASLSRSSADALYWHWVRLREGGYWKGWCDEMIGEEDSLEGAAASSETKLCEALESFAGEPFRLAEAAVRARESGLVSSHGYERARSKRGRIELLAACAYLESCAAGVGTQWGRDEVVSRIGDDCAFLVVSPLRSLVGMSELSSLLLSEAPRSKVTDMGLHQFIADNWTEFQHDSLEFAFRRSRKQSDGSYAAGLVMDADSYSVRPVLDRVELSNSAVW